MKMNLPAILALLHKVTVKLKFRRTGGYAVYLLNRLLNNPSASITTEIDIDKYLNDIHPDVKSSSIGNNIIETPSCDLQIIMPVYNTGAFLKESIDSVLNQKTNYSYHLIIVNDGSTDYSSEIISEYIGDSRVTVINQDNKGFSGARNAGLQRIFGKYLTFLDSDDILAPNAITNWLNAAYKYDADVVEGSFQRRTADGKLFGGMKWAQESIADKNNMQGLAWLKIYKADIWKNVQFPEHYWYEDTIIRGLITPMVNVYVQIPNYVYFYTINKKSISFNSRGKRKSLDNIYITESVLCDADKLGLIKSDYEYYYRFFLYQINTNWDRIYMLGPDVEYAVFRKSVNIIKKYFPIDINLEISSLINLIKSLREEDFNKYRKTNHMKF